MDECTTMFDCLALAFSWADDISLDWFVGLGKALFVIVPACLTLVFVYYKLDNILPYYPNLGVKDLILFLTYISVACLAAYLVGTVFYCVVIVFMGGF